MEYGKFYHIYNRGINGCPLFKEKTNYEHFLRLYDKYIPLVADTYAWVLMGNHFHFLMRIKEEGDIALIKNRQGLKNLDGLKRIYQQFSNLFNAYSKAFNKKYKRTGSLFEHPFRRIEITSEDHLKHLIYYIHNNPVHHGFVMDMVDYPWSSYLTILSPGDTRLKRDEVISWFDDKSNFMFYHNRQYKMDNRNSYMFEDEV